MLTEVPDEWVAPPAHSDVKRGGAVWNKSLTLAPPKYARSRDTGIFFKDSKHDVMCTGSRGLHIPSPSGVVICSHRFTGRQKLMPRPQVLSQTDSGRGWC